MPEGAEFTESSVNKSTKYIVSFISSSCEDIASNTAKLLNSDSSVFVVSYDPIMSKSKFKNMASLQIDVDLSVITNKNAVKFVCNAPFASSFKSMNNTDIEKSEDSTNRKIISTANDGYISFSSVIVSVNIIAYIILILSIVLIVVLVLLIIYKKANLISAINKLNSKITYNKTNDETKNVAVLTNSSNDTLNQDSTDSEDEFI